MKKQDDRIKELLKETREILFDDPLFEKKDPALIHVSQCASGWQVQMSFKNVPCRIGYFNNLETACRYADMATYKWREYRRSTLKYNYSETQARIDCMAEDEAGGARANFILARLHALLTENGLIVGKVSRKAPEGNPSPLTSQIAKLASRLASLESENTKRENDSLLLASLVAQCKDHITTSETRIENGNMRIANLELRLDAAIERIADLELRLDLVLRPQSTGPSHIVLEGKEKFSDAVSTTELPTPLAPKTPTTIW